MRTLGSQIAVNAVTGYGKQILDTVVFVALTPYIASALGTEGFGTWSLVWAAASLLMLIDLGFSNSVVKYVAEARGKQDWKRLGELTATLFWTYLLLGVLTAGAVLAVATHLPSILAVPDSAASTVRGVFLLLGLRVAAGLPLGMFRGVLHGFQRQDIANALGMAETIAYGVGALVVLGVRPSPEALAAVSLTTGIGANVAAVVVSGRLLKGVRVHPRWVRPRLVREISGFSWCFFAIQVSMLVYSRLDTILVQGFLSLTAVALYATASRTTERAGSVCRQLTNTLTPVFAELGASDHKERLRTVYLIGARYSVALATPLLLGLAWLGPELLTGWMGDEFSAGGTALRILAISTFVSVVHGGSANLLGITGRHAFVAGSFLGGQVFNVTMTVILLPLMGITGAAVATLVSTLGTDVLVVQREVYREYGISRFDFYHASLVPALLPAVFSLGPVAAVTWWLDLGLIGVVVAECVLIVLFAIGYWFSAMPAQERAVVSDLLRSWRAHFAPGRVVTPAPHH